MKSLFEEAMTLVRTADFKELNKQELLYETLRKIRPRKLITRKQLYNTINNNLYPLKYYYPKSKIAIELDVASATWSASITHKTLSGGWIGLHESGWTDPQRMLFVLLIRSLAKDYGYELH